MKTGKKATPLFLCAALVAALSVLSAESYTTGTSHRYVQTTLTTSDAVAIAGTVYIVEITVANKSASTATFTVKDRSLDCGGAACNILASVSIAANNTYTLGFNGQIAPSGISWSASANSAIDIKLHYRTRMSDAQ